MAPTYSTDLLQAYIRHGTLGVVYMILEWLSFRNEICSRVKFVLHLSEKIKQLRLRRSHSCHSPQITLFAIFNFEGSFFSDCMKFHIKTRILFGKKTRMNWFQNDLYGNKISFFCYHESKYTEIFGDGINSFQDEHLWTLGKKCFINVSLLPSSSPSSSSSSSSSPLLLLLLLLLLLILWIFNFRSKMEMKMFTC